MSKKGNINYWPKKCNLKTQTASFPDQERLLKQVVRLAVLVISNIKIPQMEQWLCLKYVMI